MPFGAILKNGTVKFKNCCSYFLGNCWKNLAAFHSDIRSHCLQHRGQYDTNSFFFKECDQCNSEIVILSI